MKKYFEALKQTHLFRGFSDEELEPMLDCLSAKLIHYKKSETICRQGDSVTAIGIIVNGRIRAQKDEKGGNTSIFSDLNAGNLLGEELFFAGISRISFRVWAIEASDIIFLNGKEIFQFCFVACPFHSKLICNIVEMLAQKLLLTNQKMDILQKTTTQEKLMTFFSMYAEKNKSSRFTIPFNRRELAEYLCVNRSALSNELCKMRDAGTICFDRNSFHIIAYDPLYPDRSDC